MKFETLMLKCLFVACVLAGVMTMGSMLLSKTDAPGVAAIHLVVAPNSAS